VLERHLGSIAKAALLPSACLVASMACGPGGAESSGDGGTTDAPFETTEAGGCDRTLPTCPSTPPSWSTEVSVIVSANCVSCHYAGSTIARTPLQSYAEVFAARGTVLSQVYSCAMPQNHPLTAHDRTALLTWLVCGAPND
jgi:hypothetical protein